MFSRFVRSLLKYANTSAKSSTINLLGCLILFFFHFSFLLLLLHLCVSVPVTTLISLFLRNHLLELIIILLDILACWFLLFHLWQILWSHGLTSEYLPGAVCTLLGSSKIFGALIDVIILPELYQCLLSVLLNCSNNLIKGPPQAAGNKRYHNFLIHWLNQRGGV